MKIEFCEVKTSYSLNIYFYYCILLTLAFRQGEGDPLQKYLYIIMFLPFSDYI